MGILKAAKKTGIDSQNIRRWLVMEFPEINYKKSRNFQSSQNKTNNLILARGRKPKDPYMERELVKAIIKFIKAGTLRGMKKSNNNFLVEKIFSKAEFFLKAP